MLSSDYKIISLEILKLGYCAGDNLYLLYVDRESADVLLMAAGRFSCLEELSEEDLELRSYLRIPTEPQVFIHSSLFFYPHQGGSL